MSEIALDLGITKANLYYYYPDKNALIKDVILTLAEELVKKEQAIMNKYDRNLLQILDQLTVLRAEYLRNYYVLHLSENLEWIKGQGVGTILEEMHQQDIKLVEQLFIKAETAGELAVEDVAVAATSYIEIMKGLSLLQSVADMISGMPDKNKIDCILETQRNATHLIFRNKINTAN